MKLVVKKGATVKLSLADPQWAKARVQVRPKSVRALKSLVGTTKGARVFRLEKDGDLSVVSAPSDLEKMVSLSHPDQASLGKYTLSTVTALIERLPDKGDIPESIKLERRERIYKDDSRRSYDVGRVVSVVELLVPEWLRKLQVYFDMLRYDSIVVESNGTLDIDPDVTILDVFDVDLHEGATIFQRTHRLRMNVHGSLRTHE